MIEQLSRRASDSPLKSRLLLVLVVLLFCSGLWGTRSQGWWPGHLWMPASAGSSFFTCVAGVLVVSLVCLALRVPLLLLLLVPVAMFAGVRGIGPVIAVLWYWGCAAVIGRWLLARVTVVSGTVWNVRNATAGFVVSGSLTAVLAHFPIMTPFLVSGLISGAALLAGWRLRRADPLVFDSFGITHLLKWRRRGAAEVVLLSLICVGISILLFVTMLPEIGHDAVTMHLAILARILELRSWPFDVKQFIWAVMPLGANWLMLPPYFLAGEHAARLMSTSFLMATAWVCYRMLQDRVEKPLALAAPVLLFTLPLSFTVSASTFVEPIIAFLFLICLAEVTGTSEQQKGSWIVLGAFAGYLCASKLLGAPLLPILLLAVCIRSWQGKFERPSIGVVTTAVLVCMVIAMQPYLVAYLKTGNPLFPFYNSVFRSPDFITGSVFENGRNFANPAYLHPLSFKMFWDSSIRSHSYGEFAGNGALGITLLVLIPLAAIGAVLYRKWWVCAGMLASLAYCTLVFESQAYLRYVYQVIPWFIVFGVWALSRLPLARFTAVLLVFLLSIVGVARYPVAFWPLAQFSPELLYDGDAHKRLLEKDLPVALVGDLIRNMESLRDKKILIMGLNPPYAHYPLNTIGFSWHFWSFFYPVSKGALIENQIRDYGVELVVTPATDNFLYGESVFAHSKELFTTFGVRVAEVDTTGFFPLEKIKGTDLRQPDPAWQLNGAPVSPEGVAVTVSHPIMQLITVPPMAIVRGEIEMVVSCKPGGFFRSQINWQDAAQKMVATDIQIHKCQGNNTIIKRLVQVPAGVSAGVVYGSSQDENIVIIQKISLRTSR